MSKRNRFKSVKSIHPWNARMCASNKLTAIRVSIYITHLWLWWEWCELSVPRNVNRDNSGMQISTIARRVQNRFALIFIYGKTGVGVALSWEGKKKMIEIQRWQILFVCFLRTRFSERSGLKLVVTASALEWERSYNRECSCTRMSIKLGAGVRTIRNSRSRCIYIP